MTTSKYIFSKATSANLEYRDKTGRFSQRVRLCYSSCSAQCLAFWKWFSFIFPTSFSCHSPCICCCQHFKLWSWSIFTMFVDLLLHVVLGKMLNMSVFFLPKALFQPFINVLKINQNEVVKQQRAASLTCLRRQLLAISDAVLNPNIEIKQSLGGIG